MVAMMGNNISAEHSIEPDWQTDHASMFALELAPTLNHALCMHFVIAVLQLTMELSSAFQCYAGFFKLGPEPIWTNGINTDPSRI